MVKNVQDISLPEENNNSHEIGEMKTGGIPTVSNAGTQSKKPVEQGSNNEVPVKKWNDKDKCYINHIRCRMCIVCHGNK